MTCSISIGVFVFLSFISVEQSKSQTSNFDNIDKLLQAVHSDTDKITTYLTYGKRFERSNPDTAWFYYEKAHQLALKNSDKRNLSRYISHALILLNDKGKFVQALGLAKQMVTIGHHLNDTTILVKGYNDAANDFEYLGALQEATKYYIIALKFTKKLNNHRMNQRLSNNIASVFIELKDYEQANIYADKSLKMSEINGDSAAIGSSLINLGLSEIHLKRYEQAHRHFDRAIDIGRHIHDATLIADARIDKGVLYTNQQNIRSARQEYSKVRTMAEQLKMPYYELYALFSLAVMDQQDHNYPQAEKNARQAIIIGERLGTADELREMYDTLSVVLEKMGNWKGALTYRKKFEILNDSTMSSRVRTNINRMQIQYKAVQKDEKIAEQRLQLIQNKATINRVNILLIITVSGFIILLFFIIIGYRFYRQRQRLQEQTFLNFQKEQEVLHLKDIMIGKEDERRRISSEIHDDIGSALTTIMYLCNNLKQNGKKEHDATISKISDTAGTVVDKMNEIIWSMNKHYDTLEDLITYIRHNSVELLEINGLDHHFCLPDVIPPKKISGEKRRNVYLVVKEALHNIIKHAKATEVNIEIRIDNKDPLTNDLFIAIHDNGIGLDRNHLSKFGNGLANMKNRMETIGGKFLINCDSGTMVCISLPIDHIRSDTCTNHV
jgi:signal transduction histidine kinase